MMGTTPLYDPEPLIAPLPFLEARQVQRLVRKQQGGRIRNRLVLEAMSSDRSKVKSYILDRPLAEQQGAGGTLLFAYPAIPDVTDPSCLTHDAKQSPVVIKIMIKPSQDDLLGGYNPLNEVAAMQQLTLRKHHPNVIPLLECFEDQSNIFVVLPYLPGGDLFGRIEKLGGAGLPEDEARVYFKQMVEGLLYMKTSCRLAHRDISLENVMFDRSGKAKIIDMGICMKIPEPEEGTTGPVIMTPQSYAGKPGYSAPEVVKEEACDFYAADVWSLAVCLYIMLTGNYLYISPESKNFARVSRPGGIDKVLHHLKAKGQGLSDRANDLLSQMLDSDPARRPTLEQILNHPFLVKEVPAATTTTTCTATTITQEKKKKTNGVSKAFKNILIFTMRIKHKYFKPLSYGPDKVPTFTLGESQ